ncbi:hypothetical protein B0T24DRAFT_701011 [Lasiosphaeria ovina]|uniref:Uncharacterized protein n=1 Tax=Lasiosphaeria ovina TaxID=92902 RepID=A0AAE0KIN2_9PEZI|nr:hypothetical protein B0T24DRAFT_701011 [Lasiosphaeria ovina]
MQRYWDPDRVLDVTGQAWPGGIQCRGQNSSGNRCEWIKRGHADEAQDARDALARLETLARRPPSAVTAADLHALAPLCLCRDYHMRQSDTIVAEWEVALAVLESRTPARDAGSPEEDENDSGYGSLPSSSSPSPSKKEVKRALGPSGVLRGPEDEGLTAARLAETEAQLGQMRDLVVALRRDKAALDTDREGLKLLVSDNAARSETLQQRLAESVAEGDKVLAERDSQLRTLKKRVADAEAGLKDKDKELEAVMKELSVCVMRNHKEVTAVVQDKEAELREAGLREARRIGMKDMEIQSLREQLAAERAQHATDINDKDTEMQAMGSKSKCLLDQARRQIQQAESEIRQKGTELQREQAKLASSQSDASMLEAEVTRLRVRVQDLESALKAAQSDAPVERPVAPPSLARQAVHYRRKEGWVGRLKRWAKAVDPTHSKKQSQI